MDDLGEMTDDEFSEWLAGRAALMTQGLTAATILSLNDQELDAEVWNALSDTRADTVHELNEQARAFFATKLFESEIQNGGLHQFFFNHPDPIIHMAVVEGYETLGLADQADQIRTLIFPAAEAERTWRASLRDDSIEKFFESYRSSRLPALNGLVGTHDAARCALVRANAAAFAEAT